MRKHCHALTRLVKEGPGYFATEEALQANHEMCSWRLGAMHLNYSCAEFCSAQKLRYATAPKDDGVCDATVTHRAFRLECKDRVANGWEWTPKASIIRLLTQLEEKKDEDCHGEWPVHDETLNRLGASRCSGDCDCDGRRTCSDWGWCHGVARR